MEKKISLRDVMKNRKSIRKYKNKKIPNEVIHEIFELTKTAPSSWNLHHWKFIIIEKEETKKMVYPIAYNQEQVATCSHLIVVLGDTEAYKNLEKVYSEQVKAGYMTEEVKNRFMENIPLHYQLKKSFGIYDAIRNASLAAMQLMLAAKSFGVDSCPMLSFKEPELKEVLQIPNRYYPTMLISLGYGDTPAYNTVRLPVEELICFDRFY
ncbi:nitroreductase family protein [Bacillus carboniphilus]|uniref:Nitroreductase family protein n=1 Tax=Bacillus carboniphilus TaxID=86663 RepID=A0ABN0W000_9BACI